ncbi:MAG: hypothetical protein COU07_03130 [Candidatus Harrisonbacteria bacterium CG10_big_fil_rev_8_21_14_0_10_40_38]|uniref:DUF218 domain-containing protein n=1 Tax=Candidatus Harrisonbacteria bacterium CG10_big_fil_rev_8_21_14_0_10_40_38 TaxID=1974583 RepID=A0A2H0URN7_9BACT|nr:MAG: hypothetical protein COU07_03130 [Candidatus Harrisonbacteria bacterium CG10_big_fil_rev_8_21_14_0_10_40_38]
MKFSPQEFSQLIALALNDKIKKADVILFIQGDGLSKPEVAASLYKNGYAPKIVVTGEINKNPVKKDSRVESALKILKKSGIPESAIITERSSTNTREQAIEFMRLAKKNKWKSAILVAMLFHKPRVYATFIKRMQEEKTNIHFINNPVLGLPWFTKTKEGTRIDLLKLEIKKIDLYTKKGHIASFPEVLKYQKWKEKI